MPLSSEIDELGSQIVSGRENSLRRQQGFLKLFDTIGSHQIVSKSKATVGVFDILKEHSEKVGCLIQLVESRRELIHV